MPYTWRVELDRYGFESFAKSGRVCSLPETCRDLIDRFEAQEVKPIIEVVNIGTGRALADMLEERGIPVIRVDGLLMRIAGADVFKSRG